MDFVLGGASQFQSRPVQSIPLLPIVTRKEFFQLESLDVSVSPTRCHVLLGRTEGTHRFFWWNCHAVHAEGRHVPAMSWIL